MTRPTSTRRSFLKTTAAIAGATPLLVGRLQAQSQETPSPLVAYVGTFSSPLRNVLPTQVDLPPGNGHGIHMFQVDRATGALSPSGVFELGTSPSCLALNAAGTCLYSANETARMGEGKDGTVTALAVDRSTGQLTELNTGRLRRPGADVYQFPSVGPVFVGGQLLCRFGGGVAGAARRSAGRAHRRSEGHRHGQPPPWQPTRRRAVSPVADTIGRTPT